MRFTGILIFFLLTLPSFASDQGAAKAIIVRGDVKAMIDGKVVPVKRGEWLPEGAQVRTKAKSFTKLLFKDKSTMNVGPESQMKIDAFPEKEAGIITLVKGTIRSKVTKNYMKMDDKEKSKLFIKTKTAAMGVRGTDFQVAFNPVNLNTSLITFEGAVAMAKIAESMGGGFNQGNLEAAVSGPNAVMVKRGQFSAANGNAAKVTIPVKISPVQLETLESNEGMGTDIPEGDATSAAPPKKKFKSIVPPGMDAKDVANDLSTAEGVIGDTMGAEVMAEVTVAVETEQAVDTAPPEGGVINGQVAPKAGGYIDLATSQYIPPPEGSVFDASAGVYTMDATAGYVDPVTGSFTNDNYTLTESGEWVEKPKTDDGGREIASVDGGPADGGTAEGDSSATGDAPPPPPEIQNIDADFEIATTEFDTTIDVNNYDMTTLETTTSDPDALPPIINQTIQTGGTTTKVNFDVVTE